jgi:hypothetical protein
MPDTEMSRSKRFRSTSSAKPKSWSASSRTWRWLRRVISRPTAGSVSKQETEMST